MKNVMVRRSSVTDFLIILIVGFTGINEAVAIKRLPRDHFNTNLPSEEWHPMIFEKNSGSLHENPNFRRPLYANGGNQQLPSVSDQNLQRRYQLTQTQAFPPNRAINFNQQLPIGLAVGAPLQLPTPERKSFHLASVSSPNRIENIGQTAPTILGAFNSIGLHMVQNRVPQTSYVDKHAHKNQAGGLQQQSSAYYGKSPGPTFVQSAQNANIGANFNRQSSASSTKSPLGASQIVLSSVQAYPPDARNPFVSNNRHNHHHHHNQLHQKSQEVQQTKPSANIDLETLSSRKLINEQQHQQSVAQSSSFLIDNGAIPTIYGTRDTFNLPTIYKPTPFSKNPQFEEFNPYRTYYDDNELVNSRNPAYYKEENIGPASNQVESFTTSSEEEKNPSRQVFEQLSKYGRPFTVKESGYYNQFIPPEVHPTVKSGKYAIQTNYKGDRRPIVIDYENGKRQPIDKAKYPPQKNVNLRVHSSPINFYSDEIQSANKELSGSTLIEAQQNRPTGLIEGQQQQQQQNRVTGQYFEEAPYRNSDYTQSTTAATTINTVRPSTITTPFLPTRTDYEQNEDDTLTMDVSVSTSSSTIMPSNHKYEQVDSRQPSIIRKNYPYRYKETSRRPNNRPTTNYNNNNNGNYLEDSTKNVLSSDEYHRQDVLSAKRRKVKPSTTDDELYKVSTSTISTTSSIPNYNINDAFYDTDISSDYHHRPINEQPDKKSRQPPSKFKTKSNFDGNEDKILTDEYRNQQEIDLQENEDTSPTTTTTSTAATTTTTSSSTPIPALTTLSTTTMPIAVSSEDSIDEITTRTKLKTKPNRPKFSIKEYKTTIASTSTTVASQTSKKNSVEAESSSMKKPSSYGSYYASRLKTSTVDTISDNTVIDGNGSTADDKNDQEKDDIGVRRYRPKPRQPSSRYRTTSTTINPLLVSTTTERAHTFRPTGKSRYKSNGTRQYSKYRTTTEVTSNELEEQQQSSSDQHTIRTKPLFSAKRSNSSIHESKQKSSLSSLSSKRKEIENEENSSSGKNEIKKLFPKKNPIAYASKLKDFNKKSDTEEDIKLMTSSEEDSIKAASTISAAANSINTTTTSSSDAADDDEWEYYEDDSPDDSKIVAASRRNLVAELSQVENGNSTTNTILPEIQSSSMSRHPSSYVPDEFIPPVDAYFRSWYESEKRRNH